MPQILDITPEQAATLGREKTRTVKEKVSQVVDSQTGEMITTTVDHEKVVGSEPDYIKVYYRTVLAFNGIQGIPVEFLMAVSCFISWTNDSEPMLYNSTKIVRESVCKTLNIGPQMYKRYLHRCVETGLFVKKEDYRGVYEVNPFFVAKGRWSSISQLRAQFDFVNHQWTHHIENKVEVNVFAE